MPFIAFNKATEPAEPDDLRINTAAVLHVEASRMNMAGHTMIHLLGQGETVNAVTDAIGLVVSEIGGLVPATRHYLAPPPTDGPGTVYICPANVSYVRPNLPEIPDFWYVTFVDGSEIRILNPLPAGL
jgi:hypothetical protein